MNTTILSNLSKNLAVLALLGLVSACTPFVSSDVVTFHEEPMPAGESIRIEAVDANKQGSLEFQNYATLISEELRRIGYNPVSGPADADLIAEVDYSVELGPTDVVLDRGSSFARYHFYAGRYYDPFYFGMYNDFGPQVYSTTTYQRVLQLNIVETSGERERVFEGRVQSAGQQASLPEVMPYLITAMFRNFPGENGVTKVVTIEADEPRLRSEDGLN